MKVYTDKYQNYSRLNFSYDAGGMHFKYHMLGEVGQPYMQDAINVLNELCEKRKCKAEYVETETDYFMALIKK